MNNNISGQLSLIRKKIHSVPNYPKQGILFRDISPLLENHTAYSASISLLAHRYRDYKLTKIVGVEARGFLFGAPLALILNVGFVPIRKAGKLPRDTIKEYSTLEYGTSFLEIHNDAIGPGEEVLIVDDVLATGGTIAASIKLIRRLGGTVNHAAFVIDLDNLDGKNLLANLGVKSYSLVEF